MLLAVVLLLLLQSAGAEDQDRRDRRLNEPKLSDLFTLDTPHNYYRRDLSNEAKDEIEKKKKKMRDTRVHDTYADPYHYQGDIIFFRTTPDPSKKQINIGDKLEFYNTADITDYRECNLVCPKLYKMFGKVCGYKLKFEQSSGFYPMLRWPFAYYGGHYYSSMYKTFDNYCELRSANCWDHFSRPEPDDPYKKIARDIWRLVHLNACPEDNGDLELIGKYAFNKGNPLGNQNYWYTMSMGFLGISERGEYATIPIVVKHGNKTHDS